MLVGLHDPDAARRLLLDTSQSLLELVHTTADVDKLLLAGVEGVALGANFNTHLATLGRARNYGLTAGTLNGALNVLGMDSVLHNSFTSL
jgi:hypothetical protein